MTNRRLLVVSHPSVLPVNQAPYAELARRGWHVELVVPDRWQHEYSPEPIRPTPDPELAGAFHPLPVALAGQPQRYFYRRSASRLLRRFDPAVVFIEQEPFSVSALQWGLAACAAGVPFGVQVDENLDRDLPLAVRAWRQWLLRRASFVAARSERAADLVRTWGAAGDVHVVPHHVPDWPVPAPRRTEPFTVGFAGRIVPEKGIRCLAEAVRKLDGPVRLLVAGDGPMRAWLEEQSLGDAQLDVRTGLAHDDMPTVFADMDVLVLPSLTTPTWAEQFGRVLVEALWCGVPVVGSDSGEIPRVIESTGGGLVFAEGDAAALAGLLDELRRDRTKRAALATAGQARTRALFSTSSVAHALEAQLIRAQRPRRSPGDSSKPVVALVAHGIHDHGGMERACAELIRRKGADYRFVVVSAELSEEVRPFVDRWIHVRVPSRPIPLKFVCFFVGAGLALRRLRPDLVHTVGAIVPNRADLASVHLCHAGLVASTGRLAPRSAPTLRRVNSGVQRAIALLAERWSYRPSRTRTLATVSTGLAREVSRHYASADTRVTPNGVDIARFRPVGARSQAVDAAVTTCVFAGGDWDHKGLDIAIEALAIARRQGAAVRLVVAGRGDSTRFRRIAANHDVETYVQFLGPRTDLEEVFRGADVFVLPSAYESFSLVTFEAAASGLPSIVTAVHGASELVGDGDAGFVVGRFPADVADAMVRLANDPALRARLGRTARERAASFTWDRSATTVSDLYSELLA